MRLELWLDHDAESPCDWECSWKIYSFSSRHVNNASPDQFLTENGKWRFEYARKADVGLVFPLSYYEHGLCEWSVSGEGMQCRWDSVRFAGVAVWNGKPGDIGAKTWESRRDDLRKFLRIYSDWCNGNCYGFSVIDDEGEIVDSCGGFIGSDDAIQCAIAEHAELAGVEPEFCQR
mgnify:CR=1 FL=1